MCRLDEGIHSEAKFLGCKVSTIDRGRKRSGYWESTQNDCDRGVAGWGREDGKVMREMNLSSTTSFRGMGSRNGGGISGISWGISGGCIMRETGGAGGTDCRSGFKVVLLASIGRADMSIYIPRFSVAFHVIWAAAMYRVRFRDASVLCALFSPC